jgi:hypothetical protein
VGRWRLIGELVLVLARLLVSKLLLLKPRWLLPTIQAPNHVRCSTSISLTQEILVLSQSLLGEKMVSCCDLIVPVCFNAFD